MQREGVVLDASSLSYFPPSYIGLSLFLLVASLRIKISNGQIRRSPFLPDVMCLASSTSHHAEEESRRLPFSLGNVSLALTAPGETRDTPGVGFGIMNEIPPGGSTLGCLTLRTHTPVTMLAHQNTLTLETITWPRGLSTCSDLEPPDVPGSSERLRIFSEWNVRQDNASRNISGERYGDESRTQVSWTIFSLARYRVI